MKTFILLITITLLTINPSPLYAQEPPPPPPPGHNSGGNIPGGGAPIGGGVFILLTLGFGYGAKKMYNFRKKKDV